MSQGAWVWSPKYNDYYAAVFDVNGTLTHSIWASQQASQQTQAAAIQSSRTRADSASYTASLSRNEPTLAAQSTAKSSEDASQTDPADPVPIAERQRLPNLIEGRPQTGWFEPLDSSYRMRTGAEARDFFRFGRVLSMLYSEAAGATAKIPSHNGDFTDIGHGEHAHTQIRRFVVVSVRRNFVHACAIYTYRKQGTFKRGCDPTEHAVVYNSGDNPEACYFPGEKLMGLKTPIEIRPADDSTRLTKESRIRFGKIFSIEWNVKVKDIGMVVQRDLSILDEHRVAEDQKWDTASSLMGQH